MRGKPMREQQGPARIHPQSQIYSSEDGVPEAAYEASSLFIFKTFIYRHK